MRTFVELVSSLLSAMGVTKSEDSFKRKIAYFMAFLLLVSAYILGCIGLYWYLVPWLGEAFSWLAVSLVLLISGSIAFLVGWMLKTKVKPQESALPKTVSMIGTTLSRAAMDTKLPIAAMVAVGAIAFYFALSKNKEEK